VEGSPRVRVTPPPVRGCSVQISTPSHRTATQMLAFSPPTRRRSSLRPSQVGAADADRYCPL